MKVKPNSKMMFSADFSFGGWIGIIFDRKQIWEAEYNAYGLGGYSLRRGNIIIHMETANFKKYFEVIEE